MEHWYIKIKNLWTALFGKPVMTDEEREKLRTELESQQGEIRDLQKLIENLRERLHDAEEQMQQSDRKLGQMMKTKQMFERTNNNLSDLVLAMQVRNEESVRDVAERLSWSNDLTAIAQCYLSLVQRKDELERHAKMAAKQDDNFNFD